MRLQQTRPTQAKQIQILLIAFYLMQLKAIKLNSTLNYWLSKYK